MASSSVARIYDRKDLELPGNCQIALLSILHATFVANSGSTNLRPSINAKQAENDKELDVAATECFRNPAHHHWGWPWSENILFSLHLCFLLLLIFSLSLAAPPQKSDSDPKWLSACRFSVGWISIFLPHSCCCSSTQTAFSPSWSPSYHGSRREFGFLLQLHLLSSFEELLGCFIYFLHVLLFSPRFILGGYCTHWSSFSRCLLTGCHWLCLWLPTSWTTFLRWSGWASLLAGEEHPRGLWVLAWCMLSSFVSLGFTKSWVGQVALRSPINRHALDLAVSLDDQRPLGTGFFNGSMVLSFDLLLPPLRFPTYGFLATGSPGLTASLSSSVTGKAPC